LNQEEFKINLIKFIGEDIEKFIKVFDDSWYDDKWYVEIKEINMK